MAESTHSHASLYCVKTVNGRKLKLCDSLIHRYCNSLIHRHFPNKEITCCDRDGSWITDDVKKLSNLNIVCIVGMLNEDENLKIGHALNKLRMMQLK